MSKNSEPYASPQSDVDTTKSKFEPPYFKAWLVFFLITIVGTIAAAVIVGVPLGLIFGYQGASTEAIVQLLRVTGLLAPVISSYFAFKWSAKRFLIAKTKESQ